MNSHRGLATARASPPHQSSWLQAATLRTVSTGRRMMPPPLLSPRWDEPCVLAESFLRARVCLCVLRVRTNARDLCTLKYPDVPM